jgi:hypothetical protein
MHRGPPVLFVVQRVLNIFLDFRESFDGTKRTGVPLKRHKNCPHCVPKLCQHNRRLARGHRDNHHLRIEFTERDFAERDNQSLGWFLRGDRA